MRDQVAAFVASASRSMVKRLNRGRSICRLSVHQHFDADTDEELEAEVRRELVEIARINGVSDPETLKEILLAAMPASSAPQSDPLD
jgi:hypothetical protein